MSQCAYIDILRDIPIVIHSRIFFLPSKGHLCGVALTLGYLWDHDIVCVPRGSRSFMKLSDEQYNQIMHDSETEIKYVE